MMPCIVCGGTMLAVIINDDVPRHHCTNCHSICDHEIVGDDRWMDWEHIDLDDYACEGWFCELDRGFGPWVWTYDPDPLPVCPMCWGNGDMFCDLCMGDGKVHRDSFVRFVTKTNRIAPYGIFGGISEFFAKLDSGNLEPVTRYW